jgi:hypothetical protein
MQKKFKQSLLPMQAPIRGILCDFKSDEYGHGFVDVFIAETTPPQKLFPEWIVRGALELESAIFLADRVIELRLSGHIVIHGVEGQISYLKDPIPEGEEWKDANGQ